MPRHVVTLLVLAGCSDAKLGTSNDAPSVAWISPTDGGSFRPGEPFQACAQVADEDELDQLTVTVVAGADGTLFTGTGSSEACAGGNFAVTITLTQGAQPLTLNVTDTQGEVGSSTVALVPRQTFAPSCVIDAPTEGAVVREDALLPFSALVTDPDDDASTLAITLEAEAVTLWSGATDSSGVVRIEDLDLTVGEHDLALRATDPGGRTAVCTTHVTVEGCFDEDADGVRTCDGDCDDTDPLTYPGASETADGRDEDCDGTRDDGTVLYDDDGDGLTELDGDCDDSDDGIYPGATERWYDGVDQDCDDRDDDRDGDGFVFAEDCDDGDAARNPAESEAWYDGVDQDCDGNDDDQDRDAYAFVEDCDDTDATVSPGAAEAWYDGVDQDCDGRDDDQDRDGYPIATDCDDTDARIRPGATEMWYDGTDDDCDGRDDDQDSDGHLRGTDCDDTDASVHPGATETWYDGVDQDCDGRDDDQDRDGYARADDCDDTDAGVNPGVTETWYDGVDADCDGRDDDMDGDGYGIAEDCDDLDRGVHPGATETWYDGVDADCDGRDDDRDEDGYGIAVDCDDLDAARNPGEREVWYDGLDADCDGRDDDRDGDGYGIAEDCDDLHATVNPGARELWYDGVDQDCDGNDNDQDSDGYALADDCDDTDAGIHPDATETRNAEDDDCDDACDEGLILPGDVVITEFLRDPYRVADADGEWFEVYNASGAPLRMCGWRVTDGATDAITMTTDVYMAPGAYAVFGRSADTARNGGVTVDYAYGLGMALGNGSGDEIVLWQGTTTIDAVAYTSSWPFAAGISASLGAAAMNATSNDSAASWCRSTSTFGLGDKGTPGAPNDPC